MSQEREPKLSSLPILKNMLKKLLFDILTESDNKTFCPIRVFGSIALIHYLVLATVEVIHHDANFNLSNVASGVSVLLGVISASISLKGKMDK
jgi:hypothetical protein